MSARDNTSEPIKATFREYLSHSAFEDEIDSFAGGGENFGLFSFMDGEGFLDFMTQDSSWEDDKIQFEYLADHLEFYAAYFSDLTRLSPDHAPTPAQAKSLAKKMGKLFAKRNRAMEAKWAIHDSCKVMDAKEGKKSDI